VSEVSLKITEMKLLVSLCCLIAIEGAAAQQIFKSVDQHGNVSYSSEPASGAVEVKIITPPPGPSPEEVERARQRYFELEARDAQREFERRQEEIAELRRQQIQADLELRRQIAEQKPGNVILINENPYYWSRPYPPRWTKRIKPDRRRLPGRPSGTKLPNRVGKPLNRKLASPNRSRGIQKTWPRSKSIYPR
jgi:Domain of unknown function (DUF4124)